MNRRRCTRALEIAPLAALVAATAPLSAGQVPAGHPPPSPSEAYTTITIPAADGLTITADLYAPHGDPASPFIVLFHQAGWSRGEYREIAPRLNAIGFNCIAIDLRSGESVNGVTNETARRATEAGKGTTYIDALADMQAALAWARERHPRAKILAWGSSYSAALVLKIAGDRPDAVDGVLAFSPGEYFEGLGRPPTWIRDAARKIRVPVFVSSARGEQAAWAPIFDAIGSKEKTSYVPEAEGNHGSRALWRRFDDSDGYWDAVTPFLGRFRAE